MHRLFVAIELPQGAKNSLIETMGGVIGARWQREDQLHLTLRFIGETDTHTANAIADALGVVRFPPFMLAARGVGSFDRKGRIDALWVGVDPHAPLKALHNKIDRALERVGIAPDRRTYLPHITIARFSRGAGSLDAFMRAAGGVHFEPFRVDSFCLFESMLTESGAHYAIAQRYDLAANPPSKPRTPVSTNR